MISVNLSEGITETLEILKHMDESYTEKIPYKFRLFLENNKSKTYKPNFEYTNNLNEMNLKKKTKDLLGLIYLKYWCTPEEKSTYSKRLKENEKMYRTKLNEKYDVNNLFKKKNNKES